MNWKDIFSENYIPPNLQFREKQLQSLLTRSNDNYYCEGDKGTGKTVTVLKYKMLTENKSHLIFYLKCQRALTKQLMEAIEKEGFQLSWEDKRGLAFHAVCKKTDAENITVIIDDVQNVAQYQEFNTFLHGLYETAKDYEKNFRLIVIGTDTYIKFLRLLRDDVKSRYIFNYLIFPSYNADELNAIFKQRLHLANLDYDAGAVCWVSAKLLHLVTDVREGLNLFREACQLVFKDGIQTEKITLDIMNHVWEPHKINYWKTQIEVLPYDEQLLFFGATLVALKKARAGQDPDWLEVTSQEILDEYKRTCKELGERPLYRQRASYLISKKLTENSFLTTDNVVSMGRHGRTTQYLYGMNPETVIKAFKEMEWIK